MSAWISHSSPGLRPTKQSSWQAAVLLWAEMPGGCARGAAAPLVFGGVIEMQPSARDGVLRSSTAHTPPPPVRRTHEI